MSLQQLLGNRYVLTGHLPAVIASHQRYLVQAANGSGEQFVLSYAEYSRPVSGEVLTKQRRIAEVMMHLPFGLLCRVTDYDLRPDYHWAVSEFPGDASLRSLLQQRQSLSLDEVEAYLRLLAKACEQATELGWPRVQLDTGHLFIDPRVGLPRIPAPDIPTFDSGGMGAGGGLDLDPMATVQFNTSLFRGSSSDPIPKDTHEYVLPLARLACDLLGQPQHLRGGNARYQPVPQLSGSQNILLRRALTGDGRAGIASAEAFMEEFFGLEESEHVAAHTERLRTLTSAPGGARQAPARSTVQPAPPPMPHMPAAPQPQPQPGQQSYREAPAYPPVQDPRLQGAGIDPSMSLASAMVTQPVPPPLPRASRSANRTELLRVSAVDRELAEAALPTLRLRLVPDGEDTPVFTIVGEESMILGRSAANADFVAQFRPRSNVNDARSRRISRAHTQIHVRGGRVTLEENVENPSVIQDAPVPGRVEVDLPTKFTLAGEYPVEIRPMASDYNEGREVQGWRDPHAPPDGRLQGAIVVRAGGPGVFMFEAAIIYSDLGLHFTKSGRPWMRADAAAMPVARLHRFAGHFWLEPLESSVVSVASGNEVRSRAHELILLTDGARVRLGPYTYTVQPYVVAPTN